MTLPATAETLDALETPLCKDRLCGNKQKCLVQVSLSSHPFPNFHELRDQKHPVKTFVHTKFSHTLFKDPCLLGVELALLALLVLLRIFGCLFVVAPSGDASDFRLRKLVVELVVVMARARLEET